MKYKVITIPKFERELKKLIKKYPSLKSEYIDIVQELKNKPFIGISLGNNCYKIKISIASKGKGKSGGARIITYIHVINTEIYLLTIYDKSEMSNISDKELNELLNYII